jgi:hypothetical protein
MTYNDLRFLLNSFPSFSSLIKTIPCLVNYKTLLWDQSEPLPWITVFEKASEMVYPYFFFLWTSTEGSFEAMYGLDITYL